MATIVARATAAGRGALAVVRLSGPDTSAVRDRILRRHGSGWPPGRAVRVDLVDPEPFDDGIAVFQPGPRTFTGEDTLEITLHGNPLLVERCVAAAIAAGARLATPGEFTRRAVLAGKLDLVRAEGIDQVVRATTPAGLAVARQALGGRLSAALGEIRDRLIAITAELEARLDYPADELALETDPALHGGLAWIAERATALADTHRTGQRLVDGARVALVGPVNAGKSSLFNALLGAPRALVHARAGTTRDVVEARTRLGPLEITLLDTAGERATEDPIEAAGLALAAELTAEADLWLVVLRADQPIGPVETAILERASTRAHRVVINQIDRQPDSAPPVPGLLTSAKTGRGIPELRAVLEDALVQRSADGLAIASLRQAQLLRETAKAAVQAREALDVAGVAVAAELLTEGLATLDALTGADTREDVLDAVFARFCIGK